MEFEEKIVKRIQQLCKEQGISINKLANMSKVKRSTLNSIIRGKTKNPQIMTLHRIAVAFDVTLAEFLNFFDEIEE